MTCSAKELAGETAHLADEAGKLASHLTLKRSFHASLKLEIHYGYIGYSHKHGADISPRQHSQTRLKATSSERLGISGVVETVWIDCTRNGQSLELPIKRGAPSSIRENRCH